MKKKVLSIILVLAMVLSLAGCGKVKVKLGAYEGMVLTKVTDKEIEEQIASILEDNAGCIVVDREIKKDDTVNFDYKGVYYGTISVTFKFELEADRESYSFVPGTLNGTQFTAIYTAENNGYATLKPSATAESGSNHYLDENGAIVITNKEATSLTIAISGDCAAEIVSKQLALTAKTYGVKITSVKVLGVASTDDKEYSCDTAYVGDGNLISSVSYEAVGNVYGVAFSGGTAEKYDLVIGSKGFIEGFEDAMIGHKAGETFDIDLCFPNPYSNNTRLSGERVVFTVKVNEVKEDPQFDDTFAKYMEYDSIEEYRQFIVDTMNNSYFEEQISDNLIKYCTVSNLPKKELETYKSNFVDYYNNMAEYYAAYYTAFGYSITADYVLTNFFGFKDAAELESLGEEYATNYLSLKYIVEKLASEEKITVSEDDFNASALDYAKESGYDSYAELLEKAASNEGFSQKEAEEEITYIALLDNVFELIKSKAVIKEADNSSTETADK